VYRRGTDTQALRVGLMGRFAGATLRAFPSGRGPSIFFERRPRCRSFAAAGTDAAVREFSPRPITWAGLWRPPGPPRCSRVPPSRSSTCVPRRPRHPAPGASPSPPERPTAGRSPGPMAQPHGVNPRVASGARRVRSRVASAVKSSNAGFRVLPRSAFLRVCAKNAVGRARRPVARCAHGQDHAAGDPRPRPPGRPLRAPRAGARGARAAPTGGRGGGGAPFGRPVSVRSWPESAASKPRPRRRWRSWTPCWRWRGPRPSTRQAGCTRLLAEAGGRNGTDAIPRSGLQQGQLRCTLRRL